MFSEAHGNTRLARGLVTLSAYASVLLLTLTFCSSLMAAQSPQSDGSFTGFWVVLVILLICNSAVAWYAASQGYGFEWLLEQRWRKTYAGLGGSFMSERVRMTFNPTWLIGGSMFKERHQRKFPKLRGVEGTAESWTGLIYAFYGQTVDDYNNQAAAFALAFNVKYCSFERTPTGIIRIRCGPIQVPEA